VLRNTMASVELRRSDDRVQALRDIIAELLAMDEPRRQFAAMMSGLDIHYHLGLDQACRRVVSTGLKGKGLTLPGFATPTQPSGKGLCGEEDIA